MEESIGNPIFLADGGKVFFEFHHDSVSYIDVNGQKRWTSYNYYLPTQLVDPYGQVTTYSYEVAGTDKDGNNRYRRTRITEPGGRFLKMVYGTNTFGVEAWDGKGNLIDSVTYTYAQMRNGQFGETSVITKAVYADGTSASYTYELDGKGHPRLLTSDDVRHAGGPGSMRQLRYDYGPSHTHVRNERNLTTGDAVSTIQVVDKRNRREVRGDV